MSWKTLDNGSHNYSYHYSLFQRTLKSIENMLFREKMKQTTQTGEFLPMAQKEDQIIWKI